jgi:hypothetical protein
MSVFAKKYKPDKVLLVGTGGINYAYYIMHKQKTRTALTIRFLIFIELCGTSRTTHHLCFQLLKIHGERTVQKVCPLAERYDQNGPLSQNSEVYQEDPLVGF